MHSIRPPNSLNCPRCELEPGSAIFTNTFQFYSTILELSQYNCHIMLQLLIIRVFFSLYQIVFTKYVQHLFGKIEKKKKLKKLFQKQIENQIEIEIRKKKRNKRQMRIVFRKQHGWEMWKCEIIIACICYLFDRINGILAAVLHLNAPAVEFKIEKKN